MEKGYIPKRNYPDVPRAACGMSYRRHTSDDTRHDVAIPNTPIEDSMVVMELCAFSWGGVNKCLFASDRALTTHHRNNFSQI